MNTSITSPAATMALTLIYLKTNDAAVAAHLALPDTTYSLDLIRPDFILLRVLGQSLIMWDSICPTQSWVESQLPPLLATPLNKLLDRLTRLGAGGSVASVPSLGHAGRVAGDPHAVTLAQLHTVAGACLAIGFKCAGSASAQAEALLRFHVLQLLAAKRRVGSDNALTGRGKLDRGVLEGCLDVVVLALSLVMAGTGHLPTFRLLQHLR